MTVRIAHVSSSQATLDGRLDPGFHIAAAPFRERAAALAASMTSAEATAKLAAFPDDLIKEACGALARGDKAVTAQTARSGSEKHPFLAMAMLEAALPNYLTKLDEAIGEATAQRQALAAHAEASIPQPFRPKLR